MHGQGARGRSEARSADQALLAERLRGMGLPPFRGVEAHENQSVMVSVTRDDVLRIHRGYAYASDRVLSAVVTFLRPDTRRAVRRAAERVLLEFPVHRFVASPPRKPVQRRPDPSDRPVLRRLSERHRELNQRLFGGRLSRVPIRISRRMRSRLGDLALDPATDRPLEIAISRRHIRCDPWSEVEHTLLHEMVHQWQAETGRCVDHGASFRRKAREVGIEPAAVRRVRRGRTEQID